MTKDTKQALLKSFDELCITAIDGSCKYWNPVAFGYDKGDTEAPLDKFFPEQVKAFLSSALDTIERETVERCAEVVENYDDGRSSQIRFAKIDIAKALLSLKEDNE
jgi:hypothetical protein